VTPNVELTHPESGRVECRVGRNRYYEEGKSMYYKEKVINGALHCCSTPNGEWRPATSAHAAVVNALMALTDEQRMDVFGFFCTHCGGNDPRCQCWNDE